MGILEGYRRRTAGNASVLGMDPATGMLLGNHPQALTHLSYVTAAVALEQVG